MALWNASSDKEETSTFICNADYVNLVVLISTVDDISDTEQKDDYKVLNDQCEIMPEDVVGVVSV